MKRLLGVKMKTKDKNSEEKRSVEDAGLEFVTELFRIFHHDRFNLELDPPSETKT